ncbi:hypothetical protein FIT69_04350 [Candidatus Methylopumilus planktonicus]|uniref:hypothetical protein n=1 Tax=Candidatus Methylopumilus planktonicus TaxID=1581557 RepID=UPI0011207A89|nr:hypothetical protein [Candidatus Methylopumilus planktonicus]QDD01802.1 hypothetical protein FIT69_04350 [Candidatus Methylopumilus planktonicus]
MSVHLLSFVAGIPDGHFLINRFKNQVEACNFIDQTLVVAEEESDLFKSFHKSFSKFVKKNPRGYGYWIWKPYIIKKYMPKLKHGDILIYADIGCELSPVAFKKFNQYKQHLQNNDLLTFSTFNRQSEFHWCKKEVLELFNLPKNRLDEEQVCATFFMIKVSDFSINLINDWFNLAKAKNFKYINDNCSKKQFPEFIEHRHDQAIFSMLIKKNNLPILKERSYFPPVLYYKNSHVYQYVFHALRSKSKFFFIEPRSLIDYKYGIYQFFIYHLIFLCHRVNRKIKVLLGLL